MKVSKDELVAILAQFNPWWRGEAIPDLPNWRRNAHKQILSWCQTPPTHRAIMISGARQVGKTTVVLQVIDDLLRNQKTHPANILYATFDHPLLKLAGIDAVLEAWREREPKQEGPEFIFLDEAQFIENWGTCVKHQVDFVKNRQIVLTGSAMPLLQTDQESGVGRWHTIRLSTLSFYEYIHLKKLNLPPLPKIRSLEDLFQWQRSDFYKISDIAAPYVGHFHDYLLRGGFPQTALVETVTQAQRLLREDIIDKALKRDMTALFGVRRVLDLEQTFLYLCLHDSGLLDMGMLCSNLSVKRPTVQSFIELLEATHLIYRLAPFGYGKEILRARYKIYLADAAIASAVLLKGKSVLDDPASLGRVVEATVYKHLFTHYDSQNVSFKYWRGKKDLEVDIIAEKGGKLIPFEVKYRLEHIKADDLQGLFNFCLNSKGKIEKGYVVTESTHDFGLLHGFEETKTNMLRIPAPLLCYWMGEAELISEGTKEWKFNAAEYMPEPKKHHYVPQFLLKEFLPYNVDQLWVYDIQKEEIRLQKPAEVACETNFYSILTDGTLDRQLEKKFSQIESKAKSIIEKFKQQAPLSTEEKQNFACFIALTRVRTPSFINNLGKLEVAFQEIGLFQKNQEIDFTQERAREISRDTILKHPFFWWHWQFLEENILRMKWSLFEAPYGREFLISDNPLCSILKPPPLNENGISTIHEFQDPSLRLYLPLSKNYAWVGHMEFDKEDYYVADNAWMDMFERNCVIFADKYVYASTNDSAILEHAVKYKDVQPFDINPPNKPNGFVPANAKVNRTRPEKE